MGPAAPAAHVFSVEFASVADVRQFAGELLDLLERMGRQSTGYGLWDYGRYAAPGPGSNRTETTWTQGLEAQLRAAKYDVQGQVTYPGRSRSTCDLVAALTDGSRLWIEVKAAFKSFLRSSLLGYYSYLFYSPELRGSGLRKQTNSALMDARDKLSKMQPTDADFIGFLLIGFDRLDAPWPAPGEQFRAGLEQLGITTLQGPMDQDVSALVRLAGLDAPEWQLAYRGWSDTYSRTDPRRGWEARVRCFFWWKSVK